MTAPRVLLLARWILRERTLWRVSLLVFLVLVFSLVSGVSRPTGGGGPILGFPPEETLAASLDFTATSIPDAAYPFLFALATVLATLTFSIQREAGGLAALQALGFRRIHIVLAQTSAVLALLMAPALLAFLVLPPFVEPRLAFAGNPGSLYPPRYWAAMPRTFLVVVFLGLFAMTFALLIRRPALSFGATVTFFFVGWFLVRPLGFYAVLTPPIAFAAAYRADVFTPEGVPFQGGEIYLIYLLTALIAFAVAALVAARRGEFG